MERKLELNVNAYGLANPSDGGLIKLDGREIQDLVSGIDIRLRAGEPTQVTLHLIAQVIDSQFDVKHDRLTLQRDVVVVAREPD